MYILRVAASVFLALFVSALSQLTKTTLPTLCDTAAVTLLPAIVAYFGLTVADNVNFLNLFTATPLFVAGGTVAFLSVSVITAAVLVYFAGRRFIK